MKRMLEAGMNFVDTAEVYGMGIAETVLGRVIKELKVRREDLVISTKIFKNGLTPNRTFLSRKHIIEGLKGSLKKL